MAAGATVEAKCSFYLASLILSFLLVNLMSRAVYFLLHLALSFPRDDGDNWVLYSFNGYSCFVVVQADIDESFAAKAATHRICAKGANRSNVIKHDQNS